jgi:hypothetical protein
MIKKKTRLKVAYESLKNRYEKLDKEESEKHEQFESFNVFIKSIRNIFNTNLNISDLIMMSSSVISKKLSSSVISKKICDLFILIDKKDFNVEN